MNIFYNNDPLLQRDSIPNTLQYQYNQDIAKQAQLTDEYARLCNRQALNDMKMAGYRDYLAELDEHIKELDENTESMLNSNPEYVETQKQLQSIITAELMNTIKVNVNSSPIAVDLMKKQLEIIKDVKFKEKEEERKNMAELNDYMKNYSQMTFDEYKKLKDGKYGK